RPTSPANLAEVEGGYAQLRAELETLERIAGVVDLNDRSHSQLIALIESMSADRPTLVKLPDIHRYRTSLEAAGLGGFLADMRVRQAASEDVALSALRYVWLRSILE